MNKTIWSFFARSKTKKQTIQVDADAAYCLIHCPINAEIRLLRANQIREFCYSNGYWD